MKTYWSCTKFADWIRGTPKLSSGTATEWQKWKKEAKIKWVRYWIAEEGLEHLQDIIFWPKNRIQDIRRYIRNRWIDKSHALTSNLKRGQWYDLDIRLLNSVFDELVNFVEIELAWMEIISAEDKKKYNRPWYCRIFRRTRWRNPEAGLTYLEWEKNLTYDAHEVDKTDSRLGQPTSQALAAQEIFMLYTWWKYERPKRPDLYEASGWTEYCEKTNNGNHDFFDNLIANKNSREKSGKILDGLHQIEKEYEDEDTAMLIRLIQIRKHLWT